MKALIVGGTGTLGRELARRLVGDSHEVTILSRCELKQKQMEADFKRPKNLRFMLGDIRDLSRMRVAARGMDTIFHVAALKHVDVLEANPEESVKTNIVGTQNVADAAIEAFVPYVVFSSTDKAVAPVNVYGMSKAISERILLHRNATQADTHFSVFRWGNVLGSRGSVIPIFAKTLRQENKAYLTHPEMTRFLIRIEDAVDFMLENYTTANEIMIPKIKAATMKAVIDATASLVGAQGHKTEIVGIRAGEKIHESLSASLHSDQAEWFSAEELKDLIRPIVEASA